MKINTTKIGISNFRVFDRTHEFELSPITILIGPNNSGKSSLVRALNFLSVSNKNAIVNEFLNTKIDRRHNSYMKSLVANVETPLEITTRLSFFENKFFDVTIRYSANSSHLLYFKLNYQGQVIHELEYKEKEFDENTTDAKKDNLFFNLINLKALLGDLFEAYKKTGAFKETFKFWGANEIEEIGDDFFLTVYLNHKKTEMSVIKGSELLSNEFFTLISSDEDFPVTDREISVLRQFQNELLSKDFLFEKYISRTDLMDSLERYNFYLRDLKSDFEGDFQFWMEIYFRILKTKMEEISGRLKVTYSPLSVFLSQKLIPWLMESVRAAHNDAARLVEIPSVKSVKQKYFNLSSNDETYLSEVVKEFHFRDPVDPEINDLMFVQKWIKKFGIGNKLSSKSINKDIFELYVEIKEDKDVNIADMGFGVSQIISLILTPLKYYTADYSGEFRAKPIYKDNIPTFYLEEPESNLHPNWHSLLIELIVEMNFLFGMKFIIETHSEYLIRKLQNLVCKDDSGKTWETTKIIYFRDNNDYDNDQTTGKTKSYEIKIGADGMLSRAFGPGFYDEAGNLALELLGNNPLYKN